MERKLRRRSLPSWSRQGARLLRQRDRYRGWPRQSTRGPLIRPLWRLRGSLRQSRCRTVASLLTTSRCPLEGARIGPIVERPGKGPGGRGRLSRGAKGEPMNENEMKEIKAALAKVLTRLLLMLAVALGAIDYALIAPYLNEISERADANGALLMRECR